MSHVETKEVIYINGHRIKVGGKVYALERTCCDIAEAPKVGGFWPVPHFKCSECGREHISMEYVHFRTACGRKVVE